MSQALENITLTREQRDAFNKLKSAHLACIKTGIRFDMSFARLVPSNGINVVSVSEGFSFADNEVELQDIEDLNGSIQLSAPWVDCDVCVTVKI